VLYIVVNNCCCIFAKYYIWCNISEKVSHDDLSDPSLIFGTLYRPTTSTKDGFGWRCANQRCPTRRTIRAGSFFERSLITLDKWLYVTYLWSQGTKVNSVERQVQIGEKTVIQMFQYLRDVCSTKLLSTPVELGGPGVIVQIDEFF
jgi:hypothetical protein